MVKPDKTVHKVEHIVSTPGVRGGKPRIDGHRITVSDVAICERKGWNTERIAVEFELTLGQIYAALSYYYDHRRAIDVSIQAEAKLFERLVEEQKAG